VWNSVRKSKHTKDREIPVAIDTSHLGDLEKNRVSAKENKLKCV
jgi:hypothetical protein